MQTKKLGVWGATLFCINTVVGVGIFFKNASIFNANGNNGWGVVISWLIGAVVILFTSLTMANIAMQKQKDDKYNGWICWGNTFLGSKIAKFMAFFYNLIFLPLLSLIVAVFCTSAAFKIFGATNVHFSIVCIVSVLFVVLTIFLDYLKKSSLLVGAKWLGYINYLPLIICVAGMIFAFSTNQTSNLFDVNNSAVGSKNVNFSAIMSALPGVLFAFNGFFAIGDIKDEIDQPNKKVPLAIIVSTLVIAAIYVGCSITLAINGNSQGMILMAFGEKGVPYISAVLCLVTVGSVCSLQGNANHNCDKFIKTDILFCSKGLDNLNNKKAGLGGLVLSLSALLIHVLVFVVPSMIIDTDDLIDISSNFLSFFVFILLSMIMVSFLIKSFDKKSEVKCNIFIKISAIISILALVFSTCYLALYVPINDFITKPLEWNNGSGVFFHRDNKLQYWLGDTILYITLFYTPILFFTNVLLFKLKNKKASA